MPNLSLRDVPDEYQQIKEIAERERRSINQQILVLLERSVQQQKQPKAEVLERIDRRSASARIFYSGVPDYFAESLQFGASF